MKFRWFLFCLLPLLLSGCAKKYVFPTPEMRKAITARAMEFKELLRGVDKLELFTIDPGSYPKVQGDTRPQLSGWSIIGTSTVSGKDARTVADSFVEGIRDPQTPMSAGCFYPRHAIRFETPKEEIVALICFQCENVEVHRGVEKKLFPIRKELEPFKAVFLKTGLAEVP